MKRAVILALALLAGCDASGVDGPAGPGQDEIVEGVNLSDLFAPSTGVEESAVRAEWASRDATRNGRYQYTALPAVSDAEGAELIVYVGRTALGDVIHHGVVRRPPRAPGDVARRPVVLVLPAHGERTTASGAILGVPTVAAMRDDFVYVVSSYRGQTLEVEGSLFESPADPRAAYDLDADDAMALLDAVLATELLADPLRVAVAGYDRGGSAALIIAERFGGLDMASSLAAPTDFLLPSVRQSARAYLLGQATGGVPGFDELAASVLDPLRGGGGDMAAARLALLRRSPARFVAPPPFVFAAHGTLDGEVPVAHGRALAGIIGTPESVFLELPEDDHGSILFSNEVRTTGSGLFSEHLIDP